MATLSVTNQFAADTPAVADEVNENFSDVVDFVNNDVVHADGTVAFEAHPTGPATNPSSDNQYARKKYVDTRSGYIVARKEHYSISEYADGTGRTDLDVNFTATVPTLLSGQYLRIAMSIPKVELGQDSDWPEAGTALKVYLVSGSTILCFGQTTVNSALGFDDTGATSICQERLWSTTQLTAEGITAGDTLTIKSQGALTTSSGKFRLKGEASSPVTFTVEVV